MIIREKLFFLNSIPGKYKPRPTRHNSPLIRGSVYMRYFLANYAVSLSPKKSKLCGLKTITTKFGEDWLKIVEDDRF